MDFKPNLQYDEKLLEMSKSLSIGKNIIIKMILSEALNIYSNEELLSSKNQSNKFGKPIALTLIFGLEIDLHKRLLEQRLDLIIQSDKELITIIDKIFNKHFNTFYGNFKLYDKFTFYQNLINQVI